MKKAAKIEKKYIIISIDYNALSKDDRIMISGTSPISAVKNWLKETKSEKIVETTDGCGNFEIIQAATTFVNGIPHYGYNSSYRKFRYTVRTKSLFEQLADIHRK
jgi:hypothetical protein